MLAMTLAGALAPRAAAACATCAFSAYGDRGFNWGYGGLLIAPFLVAAVVGARPGLERRLPSAVAAPGAGCRSSVTATDPGKRGDDMSQAAAHAAPHAVEPAESPLTPESWGKLGMWIFLAGDAVGFGTLLAAYGVMRATSADWPSPYEVARHQPDRGHDVPAHLLERDDGQGARMAGQGRPRQVQGVPVLHRARRRDLRRRCRPTSGRT